MNMSKTGKLCFGIEEFLIVIFSAIPFYLMFKFIDLRRWDLSFTFWVFVFGIPIFWCLMIVRKKYIFGNPNDLSGNTLRLYFSELMSTIRVMFSGLIIGLSILWGFIVNSETRDIDIWVLKGQSIVFLAFVVYITFGTYFTFFRDLNIALREKAD